MNGVFIDEIFVMIWTGFIVTSVLHDDWLLLTGIVDLVGSNVVNLHGRVVSLWVVPGWEPFVFGIPEFRGGTCSVPVGPWDIGSVVLKVMVCSTNGDVHY